MNRHALEVLQFREALALVSGYASSELGGMAVRALEPSDAPAWVKEELRRVDQMAAFLLRADDWGMPTIPDLRAALRHLAVEGSVWEGPVLRDAARLLTSSRTTRQVLSRYGRDYPLLVGFVDRLVHLPELERTVRTAVDDAGDVRDEASRELARLRKEMRGARSRIVERLEQYVASLPARFQVTDASVSIRDGRFVIPIRREGRGEVGGIVHDESATGSTLFVEPPVAIELMNRLRELELAEAREVQRILRELTAQLRPHQPTLRTALEALVELDSVHARARYAIQCNGHRPELAAGKGAPYEVVAGQHPLLQAAGETVVPFELRLDEEERTLLVSGPNTGGKTVLLKAIGLLSGLAQAGVIPPVGAGTRLPVFDDIFADIGDEQSIEASLSTFSAHLRNLREILEEARPGSLVLIDEIGSGTDPAEGGALAQAILETLTRRGTLTVATTHLGQLKLLAGEGQGVVNASLQFDSRELKPTFRLQKGIPGRSYGLAIARRQGFPADLLTRAEEQLPGAERDVGRLLLELEEKERELAEALSEARRARREAVELRDQLRDREEAVREREQTGERQARQQARELLLGARETVETTIRELRSAVAEAPDEAAREEAFRAARRRVEEKAREEAETVAELAAATAPPQNTAEVAEGARVRVRATGAEGRVVEVRDERAVVEVGGVRLQVAVGDLIPLGPKAEQPQTAQPVRGSWTAPDVEVTTEIDLRGLRADEAAARLQPALDAAIQADLRMVRIIHGKGTGALREVVAEMLSGDGRVKSFRPGGIGEGGTGVTVAELS